MSDKEVALKKKQAGRDVFWLAVSGVSVATAYASHGNLGVTLRGEPPNHAKPYRSLDEFYPFYLTEHTNPISRGLHVVGTTIVFILVATRYLHHVPNFLIAFSAGTMLCEFLAPLGNGIVEFASMLSMIGFVSKFRKQPIPWELVVTGYLFAWVGHFFFEHNRPATFIYPSYSLLCDFRMWFQTVTGQLPLR